MRNIRLNLKERSYDITIGSGVLSRLPAVINKAGVPGPLVIITDEIVWKKVKRSFKKIFNKLKKDSIAIIVPASEKSKSIETFSCVVREVAEKTRRHRPIIAAVGGGVVGDLGGFVASTYRRGVPLVHIPTTLLAQVDSSIGGKVGIDLPEAKNLVGSFYQPEQVLIDTDFLKTLPKRQIYNGMAEVIKYGIIKDKRLFEFLEKKMDKVLSLNTAALEKVIFTCAEIKARIVEKDERDVKDIRIFLNFGHTLGHAIEAAAGFSNKYNHGEAIALGMILAGEIALRFDMFKEKEFIRVKDLIKKAGLPTRLQKVGVEEVMKAYSYDKKFITGTSRLILPRRIGKVEIVENIPELPVRSALSEYVE